MRFGRRWDARGRRQVARRLIGQLDRRRAKGALNPCELESKARTGRFLRGKLISNHVLFSSYESQEGAANGKDSRSVFRDDYSFGRLDAGSRAGFYNPRPLSPWTSVQFFLYLHDMWS